MLNRRLITIPAFMIAALGVTALLPLLLPLAVLAALSSTARGAPATLLFITGYLWCEVIGIISAAWIWLRHRDSARFQTANYRLQCWWADALKRIAERIYRIRFELTGTDALSGAPALMLPRHASIADTIIPMVFYAIPNRVRLRYVMKRELLIDPCLDIVGNRLPNVFVDRGGQDTDRARSQVANLTASMGPDEGLLIYPEGTRFSPARRIALIQRHANNPVFSAQLRRWPALLPPRLGGTLAMLEANPGRDLVFCAHTGFEGSSHFSTLINGAWTGAVIRIDFWRVPYSAIPRERDAMIDFLFAEWDQMNATVTRLSSAQEPSREPTPHP